jgi:hypothetical protein
VSTKEENGVGAWLVVIGYLHLVAGGSGQSQRAQSATNK